jgi:hypothetical protein
MIGMAAEQQFLRLDDRDVIADGDASLACRAIRRATARFQYNDW